LPALCSDGYCFKVINAISCTFMYYDSDNEVSLNGKSRIITMECSKLEQIIEKPVNKMNAQESWAEYFKCLIPLFSTSNSVPDTRKRCGKKTVPDTLSPLPPNGA